MCLFKANAPRRPDYFIQPEDAKAWVEWLRKHRENPVYWKLAVFMLSTGVRISEACGLKWDAIDLERGIIRIVRRVRWDYFNKLPFFRGCDKTTGSARLIMLLKELKSILRK